MAGDVEPGQKCTGNGDRKPGVETPGTGTKKVGGEAIEMMKDKKRKIV